MKTETSGLVGIDEDQVVTLVCDCGPMRHKTIAQALNIGEKEGRKLTKVLRLAAAKGRISFSEGKWQGGPPRKSCEHCGGKGWVLCDQKLFEVLTNSPVKSSK